VKIRPLLIVVIICLLGMAVSTAVYLRGQNRASSLFAAELDVTALQRLTERKQTFLVYFYGRACEDCAACEPFLLQSLESGAWPEDIPVYKCEREANATVRSLYGVEQTPTLIFFKAGQEYARLEGPQPGVEEYLLFFGRLY